MKNILFATTALVATAGFAHAEVAITGAAEMGIFGGDVDGDEITSQFHTDIDVTFTMSGVADNGLTFGASIDLDESDGSGSTSLSGCEVRTAGVDLNGGGVIGVGDDYVFCPSTAVFGNVSGGSPAFAESTQGGETIFISFGGATLTMGDTNGAFDQAIREVNYAGGSIGDNEEHIAFGGFGNNGLDGFYDGQIARFDYTVDGFTGSLSAEIDDTGEDSPVWGLGVRYTGDLGGVNLGVGLGYQAVEGSGNLGFGSSNGVEFAFAVSDGSYSLVGISADAAFSNGVTAGFSYTAADLDGEDATHGAIGIGYEMNALAIGVNYGHYTFDGDEVTSGYGLAAAYDLGGGLEAQLGYGHSTLHDVNGSDDASASTWSLGLAMSF